MEWTVQCPTCSAHIPVVVPLGTSIMRAKDQALLHHNEQEHDDYAV